VLCVLTDTSHKSGFKLQQLGYTWRHCADDEELGTAGNSRWRLNPPATNSVKLEKPILRWVVPLGNSDMGGRSGFGQLAKTKEVL